MIEIRISGGIGNQLFQYALGYSLSRKYDQKMILDKTYFDYDTSRVYGLDKFHLQFTEGISYMQNMSTMVFWKKLIMIVCIIVKRKKLKDFAIVQENENRSIPDLTKGNYYIRGFWQNEEYFKQYREDLLKQIVLRSVSIEYRKWLKDIKERECASIHIRRTDYIKYQALIDPEYYVVAIRKIQTLANIEKFYVFTDDPQWANMYFNTYRSSVPFKIVSGQSGLTDLEELMLMKECHHHVVANSSFSWWGGWLGNYEKKVVIAPKVNMWDESFYPKEWILIDANVGAENIKSARDSKSKYRGKIVSKIKEIGYL